MNDPQAPGIWQRAASGAVRGFRGYANWLVGISWMRFALLAILLIVAAALLSNLPPFTWKLSERIVVPEPPPLVQHRSGDGHQRYEVTVDKNGVRIAPYGADAAASAASAASSATPAASAGSEAQASVPAPPAPPQPPRSVVIQLPDGADNEDVRSAVEDAKQAIEEAIAEAKQAREEARDEARGAREEARSARSEAREAARAVTAPRPRVVTVQLGDYLVQTALLFILASAIVKITYKGRVQAEVKAAQATEAAESEQLKRQVVEARMAAMQAQVEPHFLFNTLASIDHLIETDPPRASQMQKNLIALLRASMPNLRESAPGGLGHLGRELAVVRPYLEILKVRMEERLQTEIDVPDGLLSARFPPMMIQGLVENAIKHGLEPKAEGGRLAVKAQIVHGRLEVTVADTGLGFGKAATRGTGTGLENMRERLQLLYGSKAQLTIAENAPSGTRVTIVVPYEADADAAARA